MSYLGLDHYISKLDINEVTNLSDNHYRNAYKQAVVSEEELEALTLPTRKSAIEVAEGLRVPIKSNVLDRIQLKLTPYLNAPISLIGDSAVQWILMIAPTQSGKTVFLQVAVADAIDQDPGTCLYIYPTETDGKAAMQEKIIGMIKENDFLLKHVLTPHKTNLSTKRVALDNMTIWPAWAGSLGSLSSKPAKIIILDEIRLMGNTIKGESNAIKLADDRTTTYSLFGQARIYGVSTPAIQHDLLYKQTEVKGTQVLHWHLKCQSCRLYFVPNFFKDILPTIKSSNPENAYLMCPHCKNKQEEGMYKYDLNDEAKYGIRKIHHGAKEINSLDELKRVRTLFWFDSIASPFRPVREIAEEYIKTKPDIVNYKNFIQCWLAMFWIDDVSKTSEKKLKERRKKGFKKGRVPFGTKFLTAGVDAQDVGFYVTVTAWLDNKECYLVDHFLIECHKDTTIWQKTRQTLNDRLNQRLWDGWLVVAWAIDIADGDRTTEIRDATSSMERCFNIRGAPDSQVTTIKYFKDLNYWRVKKSVYLEETDVMSVSNSFHIPEDVEQDFLTQFPNAHKIREVKEKTGEEVYIWHKSGQNDYRMAFVYSVECLDFQIGTYTLRDKLSKEGWICNPAIKYVKEKSESSNVSKIIERDVNKSTSFEDPNNNWITEII
jgi:phage terminase large subunit GpA-like protein